MRKSLIALVLSLSLIGTACTADWIAIALADLPVLVQMSLNIGSLASTLQSGKPINAHDAVALQAIAGQAQKDLALCQVLYTDYKAAPNATTLGKIQAVLADISENLPAELAAADINDAELAARIAAAVTVIVDTVNSFAILIPASRQTAKVRTAARRSMTAKPPNSAAIATRWNSEVCAAAGTGIGETAHVQGVYNCMVFIHGHDR